MDGLVSIAIGVGFVPALGMASYAVLATVAFVLRRMG